MTTHVVMRELVMGSPHNVAKRSDESEICSPSSILNGHFSTNKEKEEAGRIPCRPSHLSVLKGFSNRFSGMRGTQRPLPNGQVGPILNGRRPPFPRRPLYGPEDDFHSLLRHALGYAAFEPQVSPDTPYGAVLMQMEEELIARIGAREAEFPFGIEHRDNADAVRSGY